MNRYIVLCWVMLTSSCGYFSSNELNGEWAGTGTACGAITNSNQINMDKASLIEITGRDITLTLPSEGCSMVYHGKLELKADAMIVSKRVIDSSKSCPKSAAFVSQNDLVFRYKKTGTSTLEISTLINEKSVCEVFNKTAQ